MKGNDRLSNIYNCIKETVLGLSTVTEHATYSSYININEIIGSQSETNVNIIIKMENKIKSK
jgi:hypothetical protein